MTLSSPTPAEIKDDKTIELKLPRRVLGRMRAKLQIIAGVMTAIVVVTTAIQTGDYNMMKEKMLLLRSFVRWSNLH